MNNTELYAFINGNWDVTEIVADGDNKTIYQGKASISDARQNMAEWCIKKTTITNANGVQTVISKFADGDMCYDNVWDDRAILTYKYLG